MAAREKFAVTGRYMDGTEVVGYHIVSGVGGKQKKVTREQFIFLVGRGDIVNCTGQLYGDQVILRGSDGVNVSSLPVFDERTGSIRHIDTFTNVKPKNATAVNVMSQLTIVSRIMRGRENIGFEVMNLGKQVARLPREKVMELADGKQITNAKTQNLERNGETVKILRGVGMDLRDLPIINV